jgi:hypothetical protein
MSRNSNSSAVMDERFTGGRLYRLEVVPDSIFSSSCLTSDMVTAVVVMIGDVTEFVCAGSRWRGRLFVAPPFLSNVAAVVVVVVVVVDAVLVNVCKLVLLLLLLDEDTSVVVFLFSFALNNVSDGGFNRGMEEESSLMVVLVHREKVCEMRLRTPNRRESDDESSPPLDSGCRRRRRRRRCWYWYWW